MGDNYFSKVKRETSTRLWVNNPTMDEVEKALRYGAVACTTNPTYSANLLKRDSEYALKIIDECIPHSSNDSVVADHVQQRLVARLLEGFRDTYEKSDHTEGWVSIQGNPYADIDADHIIKEVMEYKKLGPNFIAKIPVTEAGMKAIEYCFQENIAVIATEIFAISQMIAICEVYKKVSEKTGNKPAFYITHITGIFDEYLQKECISPLDIAIDKKSQAIAGLSVARKQYRVFKERGYSGTLLGGGARTLTHFTGVVGGEMHITINWSTAEEILKLNPSIENTLAAETSSDIIDELCSTLPDFKRAWDIDGLAVEEFKDFGPVQRFRRQFINGWDQLVTTISQRR